MEKNSRPQAEIIESIDHNTKRIADSLEKLVRILQHKWHITESELSMPIQTAKKE